MNWLVGQYTAVIGGFVKVPYRMITIIPNTKSCHGQYVICCKFSVIRILFIAMFHEIYD